MAYINITNSKNCLLSLGGLSTTGWAYGERICRWYLKSGNSPTESSYDFKAEATITSNSASSGGAVIFGNLAAGATYYVRCYVYCETDAWIAAGGSKNTPISTISTLSNGGVAKFTTEAAESEAYIQVSALTLTSQRATLSLQGLNTLWYGGQRTCNWYIKTGGYPTESNYSFKKTATIQGSPSSGGAVVFTGLSPNTLYYCRCYVYCYASDYYGDDFLAMLQITFTTPASSAPEITYIFAEQDSLGSLDFWVDIAGNNLDGAEYQVIVGGVVKSSGTLTDDSWSFWIRGGEYTTYTITVTVTANGLSDTANTTITLEENSNPVIPKWSWSVSNGGATDRQTQDAYNALIKLPGYSVDDFSHLVWNDMVDKVCAAYDVDGRSWYQSGTSYPLIYAATLMSANDRTLTADRFNALRRNIVRGSGYGMSNPGAVSPGETVFGDFFLTFAIYINDWINDIS